MGKYRAKIPPIEAVQYLGENSETKIKAFFGTEAKRMLFTSADGKLFVRTAYKQIPLISLQFEDYIVRDIAGNYHVESQAYFESRYEKE